MSDTCQTHAKGIHWILQQDGIAPPIVGAKRPSQFLHTLRSVGWTLTHEQLAMLNHASDRAHALRPDPLPGLWMWTGVPTVYEEVSE